MPRRIHEQNRICERIATEPWRLRRLTNSRRGEDGGILERQNGIVVPGNDPASTRVDPTHGRMAPQLRVSGVRIGANFGRHQIHTVRHELAFLDALAFASNSVGAMMRVRGCSGG